MTVSTMRFVDRYAGIPLCWVVGLLNRFRTLDESASIRSIVVIKFFGLGSIILTMPMLRLLKNHFPDARVVFLSFSSQSELLEEIPELDERWYVGTASLPLFIRSVAHVLRKLLATKPDVVIDLEFFSKFSTFLGALAHPRRHIAFALPARWRVWNLTDAVPLRRNQHVMNTFLDTLVPLGIAIPGPFRQVNPGSDLVSGRAESSPPKSPGDFIICVNPNAGSTSLERRWGLEKFAEAIDALAAEFPEAMFCLIGSVEEREYVAHVMALIRGSEERVVTLAGRLTLKGLMGLFERSDLLVTNDSGPMHVAAMVGLPTVALFGPESPLFYGPVGNRTIAITAGLSCSPCLNVYDAKIFRCPYDAKCMKEISVAQVVEASKQMLQGERASELQEHEAR